MAGGYAHVHGPATSIHETSSIALLFSPQFKNLFLYTCDGSLDLIYLWHSQVDTDLPVRMGQGRTPSRPAIHVSLFGANCPD